MDIQRFKESLEKAQEYFDSQKNLKKGHVIAQQLCCLTQLDIEKGCSVKDLFYDYQEIYEAVWGFKAESDKASQAYRRNENSVVECFTGNSDLNQYLISNELLPLTIHADIPKGKHKTKIYLQTSGISNQKLAVSDNVYYSAIQLPKPYKWTKPFVDIVLKPEVLASIGIFIVVSISIAVIMTINGAFQNANSILVSCFVFFIALLIFIYLKINELMNNGVTSLPIFMAPITTRNAFITLDRQEHIETPILKLKIIVYEANCGVCGRPLMIEKSKEFHSRYIGKCILAPSEHVFSFDHVTKLGKFLR